MRLLAAMGLVALMLQLLLVPSHYGEDALRVRLAADRAQTQALLGADDAAQCWIRAQSWHQNLGGAVPLFGAGTAAAERGQRPASATLQEVGHRLLGNAYFRAMGAHLQLWCLRLALLASLWPCVAALAFAAMLDGWTARRLRRVLVRPDRPECFGWAAIAWAALVWAVMALSGAPWAMSPEWLLSLVVCAGLLSGQVINWHPGGRV